MTLQSSARQMMARRSGDVGRALSTGKPAREHLHRRCKPASLAALAVFCSACVVQPAAQTAPAADPVATSRAAVTRLLVLNCRENTDCATVGVGARSCGGPEQYLAYAPAHTPGPALQRAVQKNTQLRKKQLEARGEMSTCELLPDPGALCTPAGQCAVQPLRSASGGQLLR